MALVALQVFLALSGLILAKNNKQVLKKTLRWESLLFGSALALLGIFLSAGRRGCSEVVGWVSFTAGVTLLTMPLARLESSSLEKGLTQSVALLVIVAVVAPFMGYFSEMGGTLLLLTVFLLISLVFSILIPSHLIDGVLSACGAALFSVWTIHDISRRPCASPWEKSIQIFLDLLNVFAFSTNS